jgi:hypothetical protein
VIPANENDTVEMLRIQTAKAEYWRQQYMTQRHTATLLAIRDARHEFNKLINELKAHHMDSVECALLDTIGQRYNELLTMLMPQPATVEQSGR